MVRLNREAYYTTCRRTTGKKFVDYLENMLIPTLKDGDIIVMDNVRSHHVKEVAEVIQNQKSN